jgi:hypothetical protein
MVGMNQPWAVFTFLWKLLGLIFKRVIKKQPRFLKKKINLKILAKVSKLQETNYG